MSTRSRRRPIQGSPGALGNVLVGGLGSDAVTGGTGPDTIYASSEQTFGVDAAGPADTLTTPSDPRFTGRTWQGSLGKVHLARSALT